MAIIAWRSPIRGSVTVNGGVVSLDPHGGGGITYRLTHGSHSLNAGSIPDGGQAQFRPTTVDLSRGDMLDVLVGPPASGIDYNSTGVRLTITGGRGGTPAPSSYRVIDLFEPQTLLVRRGPTLHSQVVGMLHNGRTVTVLCQTEGSLVANRSAIWDEIGPGRYVSDYYLDTPAVARFSPGIPRCPQ
jgi:hypothetical protein